MADVLSQREIDELLKALTTGDVDTQVVKPEEPKGIKKYDFKTANKFPKEQMRTLNIIYENFALLLSTFLSGTLGTYCEVNVVSVEEQAYYEFTNSFPSPVILAIMSMNPLEGSSLLEVSPSVAYAILSRLFGGLATATGTDRMFTEIDLVIIEKIIRQFMPLLNEAWSKVMKIDTLLDRIETSSQFAQIVSANETIAIITVSVKVDDTEGLMNFCIPHISVEPIAKNLNTRLASTGTSYGKKVESNKDAIIRQLYNTQLTLHAVLSETAVTVRDITHLQPGDVIQLDKKIDDLISVKVEHLPKIIGSLGVKGNKYAIKIADIEKEEEALNE
ncbi:MAG: flagellar motor switch protein FliM [Bacillota bacterium]|nr:flagellar motor switch protein FliM [Bacillota bacterium]